jgi:hypothetical protein
MSTMLPGALSAEIQSLLGRLVDRLDAAELRGSGRAQSVPLNELLWPELFNARYESDREFLWEQARELHRTGWVKLSPESAAGSVGGYAQNVRVSVLDGPAIRAAVGRLERFKSAAERWQEAIEHHLDATPEAKRLASSYCIDLLNREMAEVVRRLNELKTLEQQPLFLREVSARLFWGMSKVLDGRQGLIAAILGKETCPFPDAPVQLLVQLPPRGIKAVLFIENQTSFEQAARTRSAVLDGLALVFASGFKGSALRLRSTAGASVYYSQRNDPDQSGRTAFESWLFSASSAVPTLFWGDLDWSGMGILKALRNLFPHTEAWREGYVPMLESLLAGHGHLPDTADKQGQMPLASTGCPYADGALLPELRRLGRFVDQELFAV